LHKLGFDEVNALLMQDLETYLREWVPDGELSGNEYSMLNTTRADNEKGSFKINIKTGKWKDFATTEGSDKGDIVALYAYLNGLTAEQGKALNELIKKYNFGTANTPKPKAAKPPKKNDGWELITPVPGNAPPPPSAIKVNEEIGVIAPSFRYDYKNEAGKLLGHVYRFDTAEHPKLSKKEFRPMFYWRDANGFQKWRASAPVDNRPLYGLDLLGKYPEKTVLLVSGEKCVCAVKYIFGQKYNNEKDWPLIPVTWGFGDNGASKTDFKPLQNREIIYWPDNDDSGRKAMKALYVKFNGILLDIEHDEKGWDVADLVSENEDNALFDLHEYIKKAIEAKKESAIDLNEVAPYSIFPHRSAKTGKLLGTLANCKVLFNYYGIKMNYNVISKRVEYMLGNKKFQTIDSANDFAAQLKSLCALNELPKDDLKSYMSNIASENYINPVIEWIHSRPLSSDKTSHSGKCLDAWTEPRNHCYYYCSLD